MQGFSPSTMVNIHRDARMVLGKRIRAHSGVRLSVVRGAKMTIGDNTAFNYNCILLLEKK